MKVARNFWRKSGETAAKGSTKLIANIGRFVQQLGSARKPGLNLVKHDGPQYTTNLCEVSSGGVQINLASGYRFDSQKS